MGSFNCTGFHSRLPITGGDEIFVILGLHLTPRHLVKYAFDPMIFAPGLECSPIALRIFCRYGGCRHVEESVRDRNIETLERFLDMPIERIINGCDDGEELSKAMTNLVNEKFGLPTGEYFLTFTFDHRFVFDEIAAMKLPWDWEKSYEMTLEYSDLSAGVEKRKYTDSEKRLLAVAETLPDGDEKNYLIEVILKNSQSNTELDNIFHKQSLSAGWRHSVANLNPKHVGTSLYRDNEAFMGSLLLAVYRYHSDALFTPELKESLLDFMNFHQAMRYHNWPLTLPVYAGQEERYDEIAPLYRRMSEWLEERLSAKE